MAGVGNKLSGLSPHLVSSLPAPSDSPIQPSLAKTGAVPPLGFPGTASSGNDSFMAMPSSGGDQRGEFNMIPSHEGFGRFASTTLPSVEDAKGTLSNENRDIHSQVLWSWKMIEGEIDRAGKVFFLKAFEMNPQMLAHFSFRDDVPLENSEGLQRHGRAVMEIVGQAVQSLNNLNELVPSFRSLVARHIQYGVQPAYLETVGRALLKTVEEWLGEAWTEELEEAWCISWTAIESMFKTFLAEEEARLESVAKALDDAKRRNLDASLASGNNPGSAAASAATEEEEAARDARTSARWACVAFSGQHPPPEGAGSPQPNAAATLFSTTCKPLRLLHGRFVPIAVHGKDGKKTTVNMAGLVVVAGGKAGCSVMLYDKEKRLLSQATLTTQGGEIQVDSRDGVALELRDDRKQLWRLRMKDARARAELLRRYALAESTVRGQGGAHLVKVDLALGSGKLLHVGDLARLRYRMWEVEGGEQGKPVLGDCVDENESEGQGLFTFWLGSSSVMAGLDAGVVGMRQGGVRLLVIPPHLGHGAAGVTHKFGAYATLAVEVRLVDEKEGAAAAGAGGLVTPARGGGGQRAETLGAWTHPPQQGGGEESPIEVSLHPLGSAVRAQPGVQPLTQFSSRKSLDNLEGRPAEADVGLSPDEDTPPSHGSHDGNQDHVAVQLFGARGGSAGGGAADGGKSSAIKGVVDGAVAGIIASVTERLRAEEQAQSGLVEAASALMVLGSEVLVRQHSPRTERKRGFGREAEEVVNVAESEEPEETAASLLVCGSEMAVRTPRKLDPRGSAGDGERRAAAEGDGDSRAMGGSSDDDLEGNDQTPRLHAAVAPPENEGSSRAQGGAAENGAENGAEGAEGAAGVSQRISDMVFGFVFPDAKKMGIPERMSEWGKDSSETPRKDGGGEEDEAAGRRRAMEADLTQAVKQGVTGVGLPEEVIKSEIVQACLDRIVQEASRRAAAVLEASLSAGVLEIADKEGERALSQLEATVVAEPVGAGAREGGGFHLFDSQVEQEQRVRAGRPDGSWIGASHVGTAGDDSFGRELEDGASLELDESALDEQQQPFRGKSLSDGAARARAQNTSLDSSRVDERAVLDLKASLAGDLARILASVGACRREGLGIRDEVMEAFGEALVRVREAMLQAQSSLGRDVKQSVEVQEEALGRMRDKVSEVHRDSRAVREAVDGWRAELKGSVLAEMSSYKDKVSEEVESCRAEIKGLRDTMIQEVSFLTAGLTKAVVESQRSEMAVVVDQYESVMGAIRTAVQDIPASQGSGEALREMVLEVEKDGKQNKAALEACRRELAAVGEAVQGRQGDEAVLRAVQDCRAEVVSSREKFDGRIRAEELALTELVAAVKSDLAAMSSAGAEQRAAGQAALEQAVLSEVRKANERVAKEVREVKEEVEATREVVRGEQRAEATKVKEVLGEVRAQVEVLAAPKGEGGFTEAFVEEYRRQGSGVKEQVEAMQRQVEELKEVVVGGYRSGQGTRSDVEAAREELGELGKRLAEFKQETHGMRSELVAEVKRSVDGVQSQVGAVQAGLEGLRSAVAAEGERSAKDVAEAVKGNAIKDDVEVIRRVVGEMKHIYMDEHRRESQETRNEVGAFRTEVRGLVDAVLDTYLTETQGLKAAVEKEYRRDTQGVKDEVETCARKVEELKEALAGGNVSARGTRSDLEACRQDVKELAEKFGSMRSENAAIKDALVGEYKRVNDGVQSEVGAVRKDIQGVIAAMGEEYRRGEQEVKEALRALSVGGEGVPAELVDGVKGEVENIRKAVLEMKNAIVDAYQKEGAQNREEIGAFKAETKQLMQSLHEQQAGGEPQGSELLEEIKRERDGVRAEVEAVSSRVEALKEEIKVEYRKESKLMREGVGAVLAREVSSKVPEVLREVATEENNRSRESLTEDVAEACRTELGGIKQEQQRVLQWLAKAEERGILPEERDSYKAELQQLRMSLVREQAARAELEKDLLEARKVLARERKRWASNLRDPHSHNTSASDGLDPDSPAGLAQGLTNSLRSVRDKLRDKIPDENWYEDRDDTPPRDGGRPGTQPSPVPQLRLDKITPPPPQPAAKTSQRARAGSPPDPVPPPALSGSRGSARGSSSRGASEPPILPPDHPDAAQSWATMGAGLMRSMTPKLGEDTSAGAAR